MPYCRETNFSFSIGLVEDSSLEKLKGLWTVENQSVPVRMPKASRIKEQTFLSLMEIDNTKSVTDISSLEFEAISCDRNLLTPLETHLLDWISGAVTKTEMPFSTEETKQILKDIVRKGGLRVRAEEAVI
jgi:hypothetical protein